MKSLPGWRHAVGAPGHHRTPTRAGSPVPEEPDHRALVRLRSGAGVALVTGTVLASMVALFDSVAVNITVPAIGRDLDADVSGVQWVVTGYLLTVASLLLFSGVLIDHFGPRPVLITGLVVLLAASMLCAVVRITGELIAARLLQGVGAALVVPSSVALLNGTLRVADRARGLGVWAGLSTLGLTVGPYAGGWLADHASWRYVFLFNLPVILPTLWVLRHVPAVGSSGGRLTVDVPGVLLTVGGLGGITYALTAAPAAGWLSATVLAPGVLGLVCLAALAPVERRGHSPMLHLSLFRSRQFNAVNVTTIVLFGALAAAAYLLGLQCQLQLGYSAAAAGAVLIPVSAVFLALSPVVGGLVARFGPRRPVLAGLLAITAALLWLSRLAPGDGYAQAILPGALLWGLGSGSRWRHSPRLSS